MDGTLAAIFVITSLTDMALTDCPTGCLAPSDAPARLSFQLGDVRFNEDRIGQELYVGYDMGQKHGPFQTTIGASVTDEGAGWIGAGGKWTSTDLLPGPFFIESTLMPGIYLQSDGPDLGGSLQFRSSLGAGIAFDNGATVTVAYDHRSNADTDITNPGLEVLSIRYAMPL
ncbi:acyloxyacyl hydrolase [Loktanella sp. R86503]|uniref:acyloxyacyl hydrolase n=1 Tax=Loktanella sp. R86503 TaxID=3093847 RepID=UPI0036DA9001